MATETESGFFKTFDGVKLYYEAKEGRKNKETLVFLHGMGGDSAAWQPEVRQLQEEGFSTVTLDMRGHGLSGRPKKFSDYALVNFARDVQEFLIKMSYRDVVLVGHCFGGMVALTAEALSPGLCRRLVLVDTSYKVPSDVLHAPAAAAVLRFAGHLAEHLPHGHRYGHAAYHDFIGTGDFNVPRIISDMQHTSLSSYFMICNQMCTFNAVNLLEKITIPTLVVVGSDDTLFPPDVAADLAHRIKGADFKVLQHENHIVVINNPQVLSQTIAEFTSQK